MPQDEAYRRAEKKIEKARLRRTTELTLIGEGLTALPESLGQLTQLETLRLWNNELTALPESLGQLMFLRSLNVRGNQLTALPESANQLRDLRSLDLAHNQLTALPESLGPLWELRSLILSHNQLTALPEWMGQLTRLQSLNLSHNQLTALPEWLGQLWELRSLNLSHNQLRVLPEWLGQLTQLQSLHLTDSELTALPECLGQLTQLQSLDLTGNQLTELPEWLGQFTQLEELNLSGNQLRALPKWLGQLTLLQQLHLDRNPLNPELTAAYAVGLDAVKRYLRAKAEAQVVLNEAKLILIGEGEVGKSCLLGALRGDPWEEGRPTTHGIEIKPVEVVDPESGTKITLNGWDFGGQRVYRPTHQLFFSSPAVYLVVWKPREGSQAGAVKEWIKLVKHREPDAKILVVATHGGPKERQPDIDRQEIWDLFGKETVLDFFLVESKPDEQTGERKGIAGLEQAIARVAAGLPEMGRKVPKRWEEARTALRKTDAAYLPLKKVLNLCHRRKMKDEEAKDFVRISHRLGHLIHYEHDPALRDIVILKPDWLSTAVSFVLDDKETRDGHGLVSFARLGQLWHDAERAEEDRYAVELHPAFLRLMERFDLSYRVSGSPLGGEGDQTSLIAQLVTDVRPMDDLARVWPDEPEGPDEQQSQICRIVDTKRQSSAAEGLFYQLIVRLHKFSMGRANFIDGVHWQRGLVLDDDYNGRALLEHIGNDIQITVRAAYPGAFLAVLTRDVKWLVESFWEGLRCDVMVPCIEPCGKEVPGRGLYEVEKLIGSKKKGRDEYPCPVADCDEWQSIDALLLNAPAARTLSDSDVRDGLQVVRSTRERLVAPGPHAFLSYVSEDAEIVKRLLDGLTARGIKVWFDRNDISPGDRWKNAIRTAIKEGSFFLACFSQEYSRRPTTYMNEELTLAIEELRRRRSDLSWFIPIKLNACSIPDREIGAGERLSDIQHIDLYGGWSRGIDRVASAIQQVAHAQRGEPSQGIRGVADPVAQAFSEVGLSQLGALSSNLQRLMSRVDDGFTTMMQALTDEAKDGPRLFSFEPVDPGFFDRPKWVSQKFRITLWCEHSRLPLPALNGEGDKSGVYELSIPRDWLVKAAPFLKVLTTTLSLVAPVASSATKLVLDEAAYKGIEKQLDLGRKSLDSVLAAGEKAGAWLGRSDAPELERGEAIRSHGAELRQLQVWLKEKDPGFGGLVRVQNKRQEFLWVHAQFEEEY